MLLTREYAQFTQHRKSLRVSVPKGVQRSTPWLNIPYKFAVPIMVVMALLHWTMSESIFIASVNVFDVNHIRKPAGDINTLGWSPLAVIGSLVIVSILTLFLVFAASVNKYPSGMPLASSCSAAISAACHRSNDDPSDVAQRTLMFGVVPDETAMGNRRAAYSAGPVEPLQDGVLYGEMNQTEDRNPFSRPRRERLHHHR